MDDFQRAVYEAALKDGMSDLEARTFVANHAAKGVEAEVIPLRGSVGTVGSLVSGSNIPTHTTHPPKGEEPVGEGVTRRSRRTLGEALMDARNRPKPRVIVPGLITSGLTIFAGMEKVGKSFISLDIAYNVALGSPALGALPVMKGNSLYVALEDTTTSITSRLKHMDPDEGNWPLESMEVITVRDDLIHLHPEAAEWVNDSENPSVMIVDTLGTYTNIQEGTEKGRALSRMTQYQKDVAMLRPFFKFAHDHNIAVVFIHHLNQKKEEEQTSWTSRVSGTAGLTGTADQVIVLSGDRGAKDAELKVTGRSFEDNSLTIRRVGPWWQITDGLPQGRMGDRSMEVEKVVYRSELPVGPQDIAAAVEDMDANQASVYLGRLMQAGRIQRVGRGRYAKPEKV